MKVCAQGNLRIINHSFFPETEKFTIAPTEGERYQGVIGLDKPTIMECLEDYFVRSEQLQTHAKCLWHLSFEAEISKRIRMIAKY